MASNSFQGANSVSGVNSFGGVNSFDGVNSFGGNNSFQVSPDSRNIQASQIKDTGLQSLLQDQFSPINSYSKIGVAPLSKIKSAADQYQTLDTSKLDDPAKSFMQPYLTGKMSSLNPTQAFISKSQWATAQEAINQENARRQQAAQAQIRVPGALQYGDYGYSRQDIGNGKYNILDGQGNVLGVGYKTPAEAIREIATAKALESITSYQPSTSETPYGDYGDFGPWAFGRPEQVTPQQRWTSSVWSESPRWSGMNLIPSGYSQDYATRAEAEAALRSEIAQKTSYGNDLNNWEALGQLLSGTNSELIPSRNEWGGMPTNNRNETISGAQSLYGSTPVFQDGKLIGYKMNLAPNQGAESGSYGEDSWTNNPFFSSMEHKGKSHAWSSALGREINPDSYKDLVYSTGSGNPYEVLVPLENVDRLPGWTNVENYKHVDKNYGFLNSNIGKVLTVAANFIPVIGPGLSAAMGAINAAQNHNPLGVLAAAIGGIGGYGGFDGLGQAVGLGSTGTKIATGAVTGALGNPKNPFAGAAMGGLGAYGGSLIPGLTGGDPILGALARAGLGAGLGGLGSTISGGGFGRGALSGGLGSLAGSAANATIGNNNVANAISGVVKMAASKGANRKVRRV